ncbi:MAG: hemolysin III [Candidatus Lambdaproteobacteria bacterium RIFOXYD1_FULL_56_27]|uniref:Hemolysin III n=1 Tax=Candidatus Lambdaproteobacteria bacterium RIFOXYD2_FULL_56_26 TaxID=1817773 RepID=A0A1F6GL19_9PROT|nr:MAG: hemolysin III [Candidatus Lambdaproteobacteria bacterium RIFOXYD2_FULL_56_26]OGH04210.1 MAG: hemolysin III [Candidatus Lambdaproteobacteria bacterium RIFOXYC1_FULL_56_13]OGH08852.1 MAG: hemolysin III [Candidatus Lambdaproteobacteria bacterium RIFOXYD1_FULL_56_27]
MAPPQKNPLPFEELANSWSHGLGAGAAVVGVTLILILAAQRADGYSVAGLSVYGASLVLLYLVSAFFHGVKNPRLKEALKLADHCSIYLLIAGTYTPFLLTFLRGPWGWSLFGVIWGLAVLGILGKVLWRNRFHRVAVALYLGMGWLILVAFKPMSETFPVGLVWWVLAGGLFYSFGVIFYLWERLPYNHGVWHLFVLAGSLSHFLGMLFYLIPAEAP